MKKEIVDVLQYQVGDARQCKLCEAVWIYFEKDGNSGYLRLSDGPPEQCPVCVNFDTRLMNNPDLVFTKEEERI